MKNIKMLDINDHETILNNYMQSYICVNLFNFMIQICETHINGQYIKN